MHVTRKSKALGWCVLVAIACAVFLRFRNRSDGPQGLGDDSRHKGSVAAAMTTAFPIPTTRTRSFEERLQETPPADWRNFAAQTQRAAILLEWLATDRSAALRFMARRGSKDIWLPGVTNSIGQKATPQELLLIANSIDLPGEAVYQVGRWARPEVINGLANLMPSVSADAAAPTAGAVSNLLAGLNVDRAIEFAREQLGDHVRASAFSGVFSELSSKPNGEAEIRSLYATLPPSMQTDDSVLHAYGLAIWGSDPVAALQVLESIASPKERMVGLITLSQNAASVSPETAIAAVYASGVSDQGIYNHVSRILQNWSAVDPQAAGRFLSTTQIIPVADVPKFAPLLAPPGGGKG